MFEAALIHAGEHARSLADGVDRAGSGGADASRPAHSSATPFGLQAEWPAFRLGLSAPPLSPQSRPASPTSPERASSGGAASGERLCTACKLCSTLDLDSCWHRTLFPAAHAMRGQSHHKSAAASRLPWPVHCCTEQCWRRMLTSGCFHDLYACADCASIQAQNEFDLPVSDEDETGPQNKSQRLRGASQQSLTGIVHRA